MKWSVEQLLKVKHQGLDFEDSIDFSAAIDKSGDILSIQDTFVTGTYTYQDPDFVFDLSIQSTLTMACAKTLKPVEVKLDFNVEEIFSLTPDDAQRPIEGNTVDLLPVVWSNIYLEKPLRVVHPDAKNIEFDDPNEKPIHPGLKDLEKFK
jgi:uncharacterized protein